MTRTIKTAVPIGGERLWSGLETVDWRTAEVSADAYQHEQVRLERTVFVFGIRRLLAALALGISYAVVVGLHRLQHFRRAANDPHRFSTPFNDHLLTGLELADVDFDRRTCGFRALGRQHAGHKRYGCG